MNPRKFSLIGLVCFALMPQLASAQSAYVTDDAVVGSPSGSLYSAVVPLAFPRSFAFANGSFGNRPGVPNDYFSAGGFMPMELYGPGEVTFLEGEVWITEMNDNSVVGGTWGIGHRKMIRDYSQAVGVNFFTAWDQSRNGNNYDGFGVGVEWFADYLSATANAYVPWNHRRIKEIGPVTTFKDPFFTGNNLAFMALQPVEEQLLGFDAEIGSVIPTVEWLSAHVGVYHFSADQDNDFTGVSGRLQADFTNAIMNLTVTDDERFGTTVNLAAELRINGGGLSFEPRYRNLDTKVYDRTRRRSRIGTLEYYRETADLAINPADNLPYEFIHVDNTAAAGGNGSFESRYNQLDLANEPDADIIFVYRGDTTINNLLAANNGLTLDDNQILVGEGYNLLLETANFPGQLCPLPGFNTAGSHPFIGGNPGADLITLANNNMVLGLNLISPANGNAIVGSGINNVVIDEINRDIDYVGGELTGSGGGIILTDVSGMASITNVGFALDGFAGAGGIVIDNTNTAPLNVVIANDPGYVLSGGQVGIGISGNNSEITGIISGVAADTNETGLQVDSSNSGIVTVFVEDSAFDNAVNNGVEVNANSQGLVMLTGTDLTVNGSGGDAVAVNVDNGGAMVSLDNADLTGTTDDAVDVNAVNAGSFTIALADTVGDGALSNGIEASLDSGSMGSITVSDASSFNGVGNDGISVTLDNGSVLTLSTNASDFENALGGNGLSATGANGSTFIADLVETSFAGANQNGMTLNFDGLGTRADVDLEQVDLGNSTNGDALQAIATNQAMIIISGDQVSGANAGNNGITLDANNALIEAEFQNNGSFAGAANNGIQLDNANGGMIELLVSGGADFSGAIAGNGLISNAAGNGTTTDIELEGVLFDGAFLDAINLTSNSQSATTFMGTEVSGANAGDDGIDLNSDNGTITFNSTQTGSFAGAGQNDANGDGLEFDGANNAVLDITITGTGANVADFTGAANNGVNGNLDDASAELTLTNTNFDGPVAGHGMVVISQNGSTFIGDVQDSTFNNATNGDGIRIDSIDSVSVLSLANVEAMNAGIHGAELFTSGGTAGLDLNLNNVNFNGAGLDAINATALAGSLIDIDGVDVSGANAGGDGIQLAADNSQIDLTLTSTGTNDFSNSGEDGLDFSASNGGILNINVSDTNFDDPSQMTGGSGVLGNLSSGSSGVLNLNNVTFNNAANGGIFLFADASTLMGTWNNVEANNSGADAMFVGALNAANIDLNITNLQGTLAAANGLNVTAANAGTDVNLLFNGADFTGAAANGLNFSTTDQAAITVDSLALIADDAGADAIHVVADTMGTLDLDITDGSLLNAGDDMSDITFMNGAVVSVVIDPTPATGAAANGLNFAGTSGGVLNFTMLDSALSTDADPVGLNGVIGTLDAATANLIFTNSNIGNAAMGGATGDGMNITATNGSNLDVELTNSTLNNWQNGLILNLDASSAIVDFAGSDVSGSGMDAISVTAANLSTATLNLGAGLSLDNAGDNAIFVDANNSTVSVAGTGVSLANAGNNTIDLTGQMGSTVNLSLVDTTNLSSVNGNAVNFGGADSNFDITIDGTTLAPLAVGAANGSGVVGNVVDSNVTLNMSDFTIDGTAGDGINLVLGENGNGGSTLVTNLTDFSLSGNAGSGFILDLDGSMVANSTLTNGIIQNNGAAGIDGSAGISITANNGSAVGDAMTRTTGLLVTNVTSGNSDPMNLTQDHGFRSLADNNSYMNVVFDQVHFDFNESHGAVVEVGHASAMPADTSFAEVMFIDSTIIENTGDGLVLTALDGTFDPMNQNAGIIASMINTDLRLNSNFFAHPIGVALPNSAADPDSTGFGIQALADNNMITLNISGSDLSNNEEGTVNGMAINGGIINTNLDDTMITDPVIICADGPGSFASTSISNSTITGITGSNAAISMRATGGGTAIGNFTNVSIVDVEAQAFAFLSDGVGSTVTADFNLLNIHDVAQETAIADDKTGLMVHAVLQGLVSNGGVADINLQNVFIDDTDPLTPTNVNALDMDATSGGTLNLDIDFMRIADTTAQLNEGEIDVTLSGGSTGNLNFNNIMANNSDGRGINLEAAGGSVLSVNTFSGVSATGAAEEGLNVVVDGDLPTLTVSGTGNNFSDAGSTGVNVEVMNTTTASNIQLSGVTANNVGGPGVNVSVNGTTGGGTHVVNLSDVIATGATGGNGLTIDLSGLAAGDSTDVTVTNSNFNGAVNGNGIDISVASAGAVQSLVNMSNVSANDAGGTGVLIDLANAADGSSISLTNVDATNAGTGGGLDINANMAMGATMGVSVGGESDFSGAALDGVNIGLIGDASNTINLDINGVTTNNSGLDGFHFATTGQAVNISAFANLTTTGNGGDGIDLLFDGSAVTVGMGAFNTITSNNNSGNGLLVTAQNGSVLAPITLDGLDLSNNGFPGNAGFDGLDLRVHGAGSSADFTFNNLTINNSGGRGIDVDVYNGGNLALAVNGGTINSSGLQGLDINVGEIDEFGGMMNGSAGIGTFTGSFANLDILSSGQSATFTADGVNVSAQNAGSVADVTFDNVSSNGSDDDGFELDYLTGASGTVLVQNGTTGSNNTGASAANNRGFDFNASGGGTVSLTMDSSMAQNQFNNNEDEGVLVTLSGVTVDDLTIDAQANDNGNDGIRIEADSTVVFTNGVINVGNAQANNNAGSGLVIDLVGNPTITQFTLNNASFSGNQGDQVFLGFTNMSLTELMITDVVVNGSATSEDGIEISLDNTDVALLGITNLTATNSGENGLNLFARDSMITTGFITQSSFSGNADLYNRGDASILNDNFAGALLTIAGTSNADFDIFDNTAGFSNNQGIGLNIQVQDLANFTISGINSQDPGMTQQSFFNNNFVNNGGFGMLFQASEPGVIVSDGFGPTFALALGDILENPNTFMGNEDAGLALLGQNDSSGSFTIANSLLTSNINGDDARFDGDGLAILLTGNSELTALSIDGTSAGLSMNNNAGSGLVTDISESSRLGTVSNMIVLNTTIMGNGRHGLEINREDDALYGFDAFTDRITIGQTGQGNLFMGNTLDGINITNRNMPGAPNPIDVDITDNVFQMNRDGILYNGTGNAQVAGNISDNLFMMQTRDGIQFILENDAALGDPLAAPGYPLLNNGALATQSLPTGAPFVIDGNQIVSNARNGIFFDTNFTNEAGLQPGGAFVNAIIRDSLNDGTRSLISMNGLNGVRIIDNSDFIGSPAAAMNTYAIIATDITNNAADGINHRIAQNSVQGNNGAALIIGNPDALPAVVNRDVVISENGDDGLDITVTDGDNLQNQLTLNKTTFFNNGGTGDGARAFTAGTGHGIEAEVSGAGNLVAVFENIDLIMNTADGMDWDITTTRTAGTDVSVTMHGVSSLMNGERGMDVFLHSDRGLQAPNTTVWNIGTDARAFDATARNRFNANGFEGAVFLTSMNAIDQDTIQMPVPMSGIQTDINDDVFVEVNQPFVNPASIPPGLRSTQHPNGTVNGSRPSGQGTRVHSISLIRFINNQVTNNGNATGFADGLDIGVSALTLVSANISGNEFGGNVGDDIRIFASQPFNLNPPNSVNINPAAQINNMNQNFFVYDPVAYMDLIFGAVDTNANGVVDTTLGNTGDQITVHTAGTSQTAQITPGTDGLWDNTDPIKGGTRSVFIAGRIQVLNGGFDTGDFDDPTVNNFFQGVQQDIGAQFSLWDQVSEQPWPVFYAP